MNVDISRIVLILFFFITAINNFLFANYNNNTHSVISGKQRK